MLVGVQEADRHRFAYPHRMMMVLADGKHFRAGVRRRKRVTVFFIDDATRFGLGVVVGTDETAELFLRGLHVSVRGSAVEIAPGSGPPSLNATRASGDAKSTTW